MLGISKIIEAGTQKSLSIEDNFRIKLTNILGFIPMAMYFAYMVFGFINHYWFPVYICCILSIISVIGLILNAKGNYVYAKYILFAVNSIAVLVTYNSLNIDFSICCYFFPLIMAFEIVFDYQKELNSFSIAVAFMIICVLGCFFLPKGILYYYEMSDELLTQSKMMNIIIPIFLSLMFMLVIMRMHNKTQLKLIKAKDDAEAATKSKAHFLSNMSHELRTPLNGIIGSSNLLANEAFTNSQKRYFNIIKYSSEHMLNLVNDILDYSKVRSGKLELDKNVFNVKNTLGNICEMFTSLSYENYNNFKINIDPKLATLVLSDDLRLTQILNNLLSNAFKFTKKGEVIFNATLIQNNDAYITVTFSIKDNGIGIREEDKNKIFESFTQADNGTSRNFGGTGLGLSITKQYLEKFDSTLILESEFGKGTSFTFNIVFEKAMEQLAFTENNIQSIVMEIPKGLKVLLAEDNVINMKVAKSFLQKWHIEVTPVVNGKDAVDMAAKNEYDLILLDLEMPIMDGTTAVQEIKLMRITTPVIAFTAAIFDNMKIQLEEKGFDDYILKPFKPADLANTIIRNLKIIA
jgi:signal transduction histidine kinase/CheY-like chemotaxis protein